MGNNLNKEHIKDCYFYIDNERVKAMCVDCHRQYKLGWFYPAGKTGYGPWDIICSKCDQVIYKYNQPAKETND